MYRTLNWRLYLHLLINHISKLSFMLSLICVLLLLPFRLACLIDAEDVVTVLGICLMSMYFLYFGRFVTF
jgi:hypothetical protein